MSEHTVMFPASPDDWHKRGHGIGAMSTHPTYEAAKAYADACRQGGRDCWIVTGDGITPGTRVRES